MPSPTFGLSSLSLRGKLNIKALCFLLKHPLFSLLGTVKGHFCDYGFAHSLLRDYLRPLNRICELVSSISRPLATSVIVTGVVSDA